jgi:hypothetical protein
MPISRVATRAPVCAWIAPGFVPVWILHPGRHTLDWGVIVFLIVLIDNDGRRVEFSWKMRWNILETTCCRFGTRL